MTRRTDIQKEADQEVLDEIDAEVARQFMKWGPQDHPSCPVVATDASLSAILLGATSNELKARVDAFAEAHNLTYADIFMEELGEALDERPDSDAQLVELNQCAAVLVSWIGSINRRRAAVELLADRVV